MAWVVRLLCKAVGQGVKSAQRLLFRMWQELFLIRDCLSHTPELWWALGPTFALCTTASVSLTPWHVVGPAVTATACR